MAPGGGDMTDAAAFEKLDKEKAELAAAKAELEKEKIAMQKRQEDLEAKMNLLLKGGGAGMMMGGGMMNYPSMMMGGGSGGENPMMMGGMNPMMMGGYNPMMNAMMMGGMNPMMMGMNPMMMGGMNPMMMGMNPMMMGMNPMMMNGGGMMGGGGGNGANGMMANGMMMNPMMAMGMGGGGGGGGGGSSNQNPMMGMVGGGGGVGAMMQGSGEAGDVFRTASSMVAESKEGRKTAHEKQQSKSGSVLPLSSSSSSSSSMVTPSYQDLLERKKAAEWETKDLTSKTSEQRDKTETRRQSFLSTDRGVDLLFIVDVTGSMAAWIQAVREKIDLIIKEQESMAPGRPLRVAFLGYRDHCDGADHFVTIDFMPAADVAAFKTKVGAIRAIGGGDIPEDIAGAFDRIGQLEWRSRTKLIIHIADAPCHGKQYHSVDDSYPGGDPKGLVPEQILVSLCSENKIDYYFVKINSCTDKMTEIFGQALSVCDGVAYKCHELGSDPRELVKAVMESISMSMGSEAVGGGGGGSSRTTGTGGVTTRARELRSKSGVPVTEGSWTAL